MSSPHDVRPSTDVEWVAVVDAETSFDGIAEIHRIAHFGSCDADCVVRSTSSAEQLLDERGLPPLVIEGCGNCEVEAALSVVAERGSSVETFARSTVADVLEPIDTAFEAMLVSGLQGLVRQSSDGWDIVHSTTQTCTDDPITHTLTNVGTDGVVTEIDSYVQSFDGVTDVACQ